MKERIRTEYIKRTQKDYSMSFKLGVVEEIESGELSIRASALKYGIQSHSTVTRWLRKYGTFDWINKSHKRMPKSKDQRILELEQQIKLLEKQKSQLENQVNTADKKAIFFDIMIDIAEEEFKIPIRKKFSPEQSIIIENKKKKQ